MTQKSNAPESAIIPTFATRRLAVIGDSMVDRFLWGKVDRISPEAPVPVVKLEKETRKLGGAANVAANIRALGAEVVLFGLNGSDEAGDWMTELLTEHGIDSRGMVETEDRPTTIKTRIIAHSQQVVRTDREDDRPVPDHYTREILMRLEALGPFDGYILSDYGKGVLTDSALRQCIDRAKAAGSPIVVDPKRGDYSQYHGVTSLTPNQKEAEQACAMSIIDESSLSKAGKALLERTAAEAVLVTRGEHGMALFCKDGQEHHLPTEATRVYDVTGAGDTVIAVYTTALAAGVDFATAASLANHAAGVAVKELGTVAVTAEQLRDALIGEGQS
jgi:D-glycero-beta-D-manno-heptose-7-phosphate kinase